MVVINNDGKSTIWKYGKDEWESMVNKSKELKTPFSLVNNNVYGTYRKSYVPFKNPNEVIDELKNELHVDLKDSGINPNDYEQEVIQKSYDEFGVPVWTIAIKAKEKVLA